MKMRENFITKICNWRVSTWGGEEIVEKNKKQNENMMFSPFHCALFI